ncbi:beta-glucosidase [Streptomyces sp. WI04-05B]|uniref:beta-glucosidase n=1 Tax=Streptomyces TaxID=1883 RepID=UPI0029A602EB|nr:MULTISPECIES: glycoside hydrolase family 3 C-terminal domain-containing protein [unclassified Streptomyces]MDX2540517.1 glycoside hydrolase family 3 C-terminal domain-containing protein [Streptomyces sp. WI04-05B]MDX2585051.1 glycoside hydrolase family 3 C-terminal domain-containing protein [Streptomyces sp. WI04-05A]MDX3749319.1 glycoside hydrolase family 3 C-terminal domain-containing protein [Streptomyces sp. AK08-02]
MVTGTPGSDPTSADAAREAAVEAALGKLDLDAKARLLAGQDTWSLPELPEIGLSSLVMSDGPIGVRGTRWTADDPSVALPSPTALAATWDPELARRAGVLLAQEARRKGVHVLLAPTVNLHRSPLGGRHFEAYSEDPYLTGRIGAGYVNGVQSGGVGTTVKHFVANDAETDRFTVDNLVSARALRELYLAPFEAIVENAHPWGIMTAYNTVNGTTMSEHRYLVNEVLRGEWGFDGYNVSDWLAARSTTGAIEGGLDVAMPGPKTVYGTPLAQAVRDGEVAEATLDGAVRNVLRLAARVGILEGAEPAVAHTDLPAPVDGEALAREIAHRSFVLVRNEGALPLPEGRTVALIGAAARDARVLGGGSATVFPAHVVSPLDGLTAALPEGAVTYAVGADPNTELAVADNGFVLRAVCRDATGTVLGTGSAPNGQINWMGSDLPEGVTHDRLHTVELTGTFTPRDTGRHSFGIKGLGPFTLTVDGTTYYDDVQTTDSDDPFISFFGDPELRAEAQLAADTPVEVSLTHGVTFPDDAPLAAVGFSLCHQEPRRGPDELIAEAAEAARAADTAVVVVATTERVESEGFDRVDLRLPGRQDDLVRAVVAANPNTVVVVNSGSPVELPWRDEVAAVLLSWFPGQEGGAALADVLTGAREPGGRLPTTWGALADAPVTRVTPTDGELPYTEGVFIGYRAWEKEGRTPSYAFGHGLGYTDWTYETIEAEGAVTASAGVTVTVRVTNAGTRPGREVVQAYLAPTGQETPAPDRPARWLAGFAGIEAAPGETVEVTLELPRRAFEIWDESAGAWAVVKGSYEIQVGRSITDRRLTAPITV